MDLPTSGHVTIGGEVVSSSSEHERSQLRLQKVGFVFQNFSLIPVLTMVWRREDHLRGRPPN
jgi:ABC-type lipoprotein export system ATPase subunit